MVDVTEKRKAGEMVRVAEGIHKRNGAYIVLIWNPSKGKKGGYDWHRLGAQCACGQTHAGSTLTDARALKRKLESEKRTSRTRAGAKTVDEWAGRYEDEKWVPGQWLELVPRKAESTNISNDERVRAFAREFAGRTLASISEEEAAGFALANPGSFKEVHAMFNDAARLKLVESNPFAGVQVKARAGRRDIIVLADDELAQLSGIARAVHGAYGPVFAAMIEVAAWTGLRPGELFLLSLERHAKLNWVDLRAGVVHVEWALGSKTGKVTRPKKESQREVVLLPGAEDALRSIAELQESGMPLFLTKTGKPFSQRTHFYYWNPVRLAFASSLPAHHHLNTRATAERDGPDAIENFDFYELRHFFGTKLAHPPAGVQPATPYEIAAMMGHKDGGQLAMERYIHVRSEDAQKSIRNAWRRAG